MTPLQILKDARELLSGGKPWEYALHYASKQAPMVSDITEARMMFFDSARRNRVDLKCATTTHADILAVLDKAIERTE